MGFQACMSAFMCLIAHVGVLRFSPHFSFFLHCEVYLCTHCLCVCLQQFLVVTVAQYPSVLLRATIDSKVSFVL